MTEAETKFIAGARHNRLPLAGLFVLFVLVLIPAAAYACDDCYCEPTNHGSVIPPPPGYTFPIYCSGADTCLLCGGRTIRCVLRDEHEITTQHILEEFEDQEEFMVNPTNPLDQTRVWGGYILPAMMMMTEQLVHTAMYQMMTLGAMFDAQQQIETQTLFHKLVAEAHQDYQPSHDMCVIGTNVRSLAEAERNAEYTTFVMSQRSMDRQLGNQNSAAARGDFDDHCFRLRQFRRRYCDMKDNNEHMAMICNPDTSNIMYQECMPDNPGAEITNERKNKDISYTRTVDRANTLDIDFYTSPQAQTLSDDEQDIFALANNLYSGDVMFRMPETSLKQRDSQDELLDMRTIAAKRSVAEHSFNTIVGMKAMSKEDATQVTYPYMRLILEHLGLDNVNIAGSSPGRNELEIYLGERPSYYAQMEVLTKRLYQSPDFFTNLYDEPVNVERKGVALQAIGLMQDFDTWNSYLRTEAMLSVMLELELLKLNSSVQNQMRNMRGGGIQL